VLHPSAGRQRRLVCAEAAAGPPPAPRRSHTPLLAAPHTASPARPPASPRVCPARWSLHPTTWSCLLKAQPQDSGAFLLSFDAQAFAQPRQWRRCHSMLFEAQQRRLTKPLVSTTNTTNRAVVCGSGVAGLVAARVLSDHFDEVRLLCVWVGKGGGVHKGEQRNVAPAAATYAAHYAAGLQHSTPLPPRSSVVHPRHTRSTCWSATDSRCRSFSRTRTATPTPHPPPARPTTA